MSYIPLIAKIDSLPPLPESVVQIESLYANGDPDIDDIVEIIKNDPALTADILAKVNAPYYGFSKSIISILQAITLFGSTQIRSIVLSSSLNRCFDIDLSAYGISTNEFAKISTMQSELIFQWYMRVNIDIARNLTPIAFIMETSKILISKDIIETGQKKNFYNDLQEFQDTSFVENKYTMMTSAQINTLVFEHLNLNDTFIEAMKYLDNEREAPEYISSMVVALRAVRAAVNTKSQFTDDSLNDAFAILDENSLDIEVFKKSVQLIKNKYLK
ncbi:MAG: HDOD domain-containing protein [Campylobacterota bacterium]|nr:HDOD domain-containing protein [Campylobacterota bacterium]